MNKIQCSIISITTVVFVSSCFFSDNSQNEPFDEDFNQENENSLTESNQENESNIFEENAEALQVFDGTLPHPKEANSWETKVLILSSKQPSPESVRSCLNEVEAIAHMADNEQSLIEAQQKLLTSVVENVAPYHWCFYQMVRHLDDELENQQSTFKQKGDLFYEEMKKLWIISQALDESTSSHQYFDYLRTRFLQISREQFGRHMTIYGPPIRLQKGDDEEDPSNVMNEAEDILKPAGQALPEEEGL